MSASRNTLAEAIEAWRALSEDQRDEVTGDIAAEGVSSHGDDHPAHDAARALLYAAAEPEAKAACVMCGGAGWVTVTSRGPTSTTTHNQKCSCSVSP